MSGRFFAGVELGGTKSIAVLAREDHILDEVRVPTRAPDETLAVLARHILGWSARHPVAGLGIASFGPIRLDGAASDFGRMLQTPKAGWSGAPVAAALTAGLGCPWRIDTDVNGAALAEYRWGAGRGTKSLCYVTIGTGVGGGLVLDGRTVQGALHPEIGHLMLRRKPGDGFAGVCPFHGDCIEGLISGPALLARLGGDPMLISADDPRWDLVVSDIAELAAAILLTTSAERILIGGGIGTGRPELLAGARKGLVARLGGYLPFLDARSASDIVRTAGLGARAGPLGALALAMAAVGS